MKLRCVRFFTTGLAYEINTFNAKWGAYGPKPLVVRMKVILFSGSWGQHLIVQELLND